MGATPTKEELTVNAPTVTGTANQKQAGNENKDQEWQHVTQGTLETIPSDSTSVQTVNVPTITQVPPSSIDMLQTETKVPNVLSVATPVMDEIIGNKNDHENVVVEHAPTKMMQEHGEENKTNCVLEHKSECLTVHTGSVMSVSTPDRTPVCVPPLVLLAWHEHLNVMWKRKMVFIENRLPCLLPLVSFVGTIFTKIWDWIISVHISTCIIMIGLVLVLSMSHASDVATQKQEFKSVLENMEKMYCNVSDATLQVGKIDSLFQSLCQQLNVELTKRSSFRRSFHSIPKSLEKNIKKQDDWLKEQQRHNDEIRSWLDAREPAYTFDVAPDVFTHDHGCAITPVTYGAYGAMIYWKDWDEINVHGNWIETHWPWKQRVQKNTQPLQQVLQELEDPYTVTLEKLNKLATQYQQEELADIVNDINTAAQVQNDDFNAFVNVFYPNLEKQSNELQKEKRQLESDSYGIVKAGARLRSKPPFEKQLPIDTPTATNLEKQLPIDTPTATNLERQLPVDTPTATSMTLGQMVLLLLYSLPFCAICLRLIARYM